MGREETLTLYTPARVPGGTCNTIAREGQVKEGVKLPLCSQVRRCPPRWDLARLTPGGTGVRAALCLSQTAGSCLRVPARLAGHAGQRDQGTGEEAQPRGTLSVQRTSWSAPTALSCRLAAALLTSCSQSFWMLLARIFPAVGPIPPHSSRGELSYGCRGHRQLLDGALNVPWHRWLCPP